MPEVKIDNLDTVKRIYFVGIKGVGTAGLAVIAKEAGFEVRGSDVKEEFITDSILKKHRIVMDEGFNPKSIQNFLGNNPQEALVITTAAHEGLLNPQCRRAKELGVKVLTHGQAVGFFMGGALFNRKFKGISILGCHGKTTITAMLASAFKNARLDPSYCVGTSQIFPEGDAGHFGKAMPAGRQGEYFIAEADEFISDTSQDRTVKFLYQYPDYAVINNIDFDHPDVYANLDQVKDVFFKFASENLKENGILIINGDDPNMIDVKFDKKIKIITYGEKDSNDLMIREFNEKGWGSEFEVVLKGTSLGKFKLSVPGFHNAKNSLSVIALMSELGIDLGLIKNSIANFQGTKRRQEKLGITKNGAIVVDDYAHHPDEIEKTIEAIKKAYPEKKMICLFQPHTLGRTIALKEKFVKAFLGAEEVIFLPIFTSKRESEINYEQLYSSIKKTIQDSGLTVYFPDDTRNTDEMQNSPYFYEKNRFPVVKYILNKFDKSNFVILTLGAGDLYRIGYDLVSNE